ncbi:MAG TPA: FAD/NAD(P)-binding protein, partial [Lacipirellulaceae bacterium]|nr:FAD/NAD(P)-binding protein [Lacipirellulaceae bacterium]
STSRAEHLLNVAARNMSALPDHPTHFVEWLRSRSEFNNVTDAELRETFVPRKIYGDYICSLLASYLHPIDPKSQVDLQVIDDEALSVAIDGGEATITLKSGEPVAANIVLLATGNQPPSSFPSDSPLTYDPRFRADPWSNWAEHLPPPGGHIVLLGTGLTAIDVIVTLAELNWHGRITAISRSGLLPRPHFRGIVYPDFIPENAPTLPLHDLAKIVQQQCQRLERMSQNPAIAIDKMRPYTQRIWRGLSTADKKEFLRRHAARWNSIRHRIAISIHQRITDALDAERLEILEATIESLSACDDALKVNLRNHADEKFAVAADLVINCTGPDTRMSQTDSPLLRNLLRSGLISGDDLDMGVVVNDDYQTLTADGEASPVCYAIGPLLRGTLWETTAVPELRVQAMNFAQSILQQHERAPQESVIEYCI